MSDHLTIDGFGPLPLRRPTSVDEVGDLIREAAVAGRGVYPVGGGTTLDLGRPPAKPGFALATGGLAGIVDYPARDMTVTVRAGTPYAELERVLATEGQRLPVDVPSPERATLGGAVAANKSGPRRLGFGTLRDSVIGITFVAADGTAVSGGGRVVKNVAGYDLMKLHIGALGTLGVVTQLTLKVTPRPEDSALVAFGLSAAALGPTLDRLHASSSRPVAVEVLNSATAHSLNLEHTDPWVIVAGFEEKQATVAWQVAALKDELTDAPVRLLTEIRGPDCELLWSALTGLQVRPDARFLYRATVRPGRVAAFLTAAAAAHPDVLLHAHGGSGIVYGHVPGELTVAQASAMLTTLTPLTADANGRLTVRRCPPEWKKVLPVWGVPGGDHELMRTVKKTLDPDDVLNPGRLFA